MSTQAPVTVNATGQSKKYVQQAFHPSLFTRQRSASVGSSLPTRNEEKEPQGSQKVTCDTNLPDWQTIPVNRNPNKKRKLSNQSPEIIATSNMFDGLPVVEEPTQSKGKKPSKPPPIILYGVQNVNKLTEFLESATERTKFKFKIVNKTQIRIMSEDIDVYKKLITAVREKGLIGHTFNRKEDRNYRLVVRNLHHTTPIDEIKTEFEKTGNIVVGEIINARFGPDKKPTSTFFVNLQPSPQNKAAKQIRHIFHQVVTIEDPKKRTTIVQCQRCQQYGHTKNYCMRPGRCLKCAESHLTKDCPKVDHSTPATCALCLGPHPANYKGCEVYKEILARKTQRSSLSARKAAASRSPNSGIGPNPQHTNQPTKPPTTNTPRKYNEVAKSNHLARGTNQQSEPEVSQQSLNNRIEEIFIKQSQKIDTILQQMSTILGLLTTLVNKLSQK